METVTLDVSGLRPVAGQAPEWLDIAGRGDGDDDGFLPATCVRVRAGFELTSPTRALATPTQTYAVSGDEVLMIELADGGALVISAQRLHASLAADRAELLGEHGEVRCAPLGVATGATRFFVLTVDAGEDEILLAARRKLAKRLTVTADCTPGDDRVDLPALGVGHLDTQALLAAIEERLARSPGLYCWDGQLSASLVAGSQADDWCRGELVRAQQNLQHAADQRRPVLVFLHGLGSSTLGSFGDLLTDQRSLWQAMQRRFNGGLYAFEHRTWSANPVDNALQLLAALPDDLDVSFVAHSRGGLVADLLCLQDFASLIDDHRPDLPDLGGGDLAQRSGASFELDRARAEQRTQLQSLASQLATRRLVVRRYVRIACPGRGTRLASGSLERFLSTVLTLISRVPCLADAPLVSAFTRAVLEIAYRRTDARLIPGVEAMLPESALARLLREAPVRSGVAMAVIAGDHEGSTCLQLFGSVLGDPVFDDVDHDLVVDCRSMLAGIAPQACARALIDRGADVSHFRYLANLDTRTAVRDWLLADDPLALPAYEALVSDSDGATRSRVADRRDPRFTADDRPRGVVAPDRTAAHLHVGDERVRVDEHEPPPLATGTASDPLLGTPPRRRSRARPRRRLEVSVKAMDLRFLTCPLLLGHYDQDPIAGAEALIDRELLDGDLSQRYRLGLYAGATGTATVVLRVPNEQERRRGSLNGAVVCGLGAYDGSLTVRRLTDAVRAGTLRYLLQVIDVLGKDGRELPLAALLLGYNSSANLSVDASVEAVLRGVIEANARFQEVTGLDIRVSRLDLVELFQATAIAAVYALRQMPTRLAELARRQRVELSCRPHLVEGDGVRRRQLQATSGGYWPRLLVTTSEMPAAAQDGRAVSSGEHFRFLYLGQRARAEALVQQRQPGLVERLVRQQIQSPRWQVDFGRTLFQLLVPNEFKDTTRQVENFVLVVDERTANVPWELMVTDIAGAGEAGLPLAAKTPVVRQLATTVYRREVRQGCERRALVIGNPAVDGFAKAFPDPDGAAVADPSSLVAAEEEAQAIAQLLRRLDYSVERAIGRECRAADVLTRLYQDAFRVLHVSAHGLFKRRHVDGDLRTGVVLSDGLLLTAAEIRAMESVPELVFLNCCHLGRLDSNASEDTLRTMSDGNLFAASISRELIATGVRCVIVAGWAVDDRGAMIFGKAFYRALLLEGKAFGVAVFEARRAVWAANPEDITWGAFQAYGDPAWRAELRSLAHSETETVFAAPDELVDELNSRRAAFSRATEWHGEREAVAAAAGLRRLLSDRCPPEWLQLPTVQSALAATWADLGDWANARQSYLAAIESSSEDASLPIGDVEKLASVEARLGEQNSDEALIDQALERLLRLQRLIERGSDNALRAPSAVLSSAGGIAKRKASLCANQVLAVGTKSAADRPPALAAMDAALAQSVALYSQAEGRPGEPDFSSYNALNRLGMEALLNIDGHSDPESIALARSCRQAAGEAYRHRGSFWDAIMDAESLLVEHLLDRSLHEDGSAGQAAVDELLRAYRETLSNLTVKPSEFDSVLTQLRLLATFCRVRSLSTTVRGWQLASERLTVIADAIGALQGGVGR